MDQSLPERPLLPEFLALRAAKDDDAAVRTFLELLQDSPVLARWLWEHFANSSATRQRLARYLKDGQVPKANGNRLLGWLAGGADPLAASRACVATFRGNQMTDKPYGGLSRSVVWRLIRRYQAGNIDVGAFLLVYGWRFPETVSGGRLRLGRASAAFFVEAIQGNRPELLRHAAKAHEFLADKQKGTIGRSDYGYANWWKLSVLAYALNNPKPHYRTGELREHLIAQRLKVDVKDIREFCKKHGIRRDTQPGRPRLRPD
jgi:hypothetical protein